MNRTIFFLFSFFAVFITNAQNVSTTEYYDFFNLLNKTDTSIVILDRHSSLDIKEMKNEILSDSLFSTQDKAFIISQIDNFKKYNWKKDKLLNVKVIQNPRHNLFNIMLKTIGIKSDFWKSFHKKYGEESGLESYSIPVFSVDRKYCIVYTSWKGGWLNGGGGTKLYKWENNNWTFVKYYFMWIS